MKILNFGSCNIDMVYGVDHIVAPGETESVNIVERFPGGKGLNQSIAASRAGGKVFHAGCVGNDDDMLRATLERSGVDTRYLKTVPEKTGTALIQVENSGENSILLYAGANHAVTKEHIDSVISDFDENDLLILQNEINNIPYITDKAYSKGIKIILNPSPFNEVIKSVDLNKIYCLMLNEVEASQFCGTDGTEEFVKKIRSDFPELRVVLTLGKRGCIYIENNRMTEIAAHSVNPVDTTAAGDTFTGYFVTEISKGVSPVCALKKATAASAIAITRKGASVSIPSANEVEEFLVLQSK